MVRFSLALMAVGVWIILTNNDLSVPTDLEDQLSLMALLPAAFLLGASLLRE